MDRRAFLRGGAKLLGGAALVSVAGPGLLDACSAKSTHAAAGSLGTLNFNLPWIPDVESGGEFVAKAKGYYTQQGFSGVNLIPAGPNATPQETVVLTGKALVAVTSLDSTAASIQKGNPLKVIGTQYQKNPFCIMSRASNPLNTPQDMIGKKIGVQSVNDAVWAAFLQANNIQMSQVKTQVVSFDPTPLAQGQVDGWFSFITNEPIALGLQGVQTHTFLLADYNYPEIGNVYIATADSIKNNLGKVKACLTAEIIAWKECISNPNEAAMTTLAQFPSAGSLPAQQQQSVAQNKLIVIGDAVDHGLFYITPATQTTNCHTLGLGGTTVTPSQVFDMSVLDAIYSAQSSLKSIPALGTI
ncbi:MAG: ABC transporter substrate-binding protein [Acidimicrobiales bacterium]